MKLVRLAVSPAPTREHRHEPPNEAVSSPNEVASPSAGTHPYQRTQVSSREADLGNGESTWVKWNLYIRRQCRPAITVGVATGGG